MIRVHVQPYSRRGQYQITADDAGMRLLREAVTELIAAQTSGGILRDEVTDALDALLVIRCPSCPTGIVGQPRTHKMGCHFHEGDYAAWLKR